MPCKIDTVSSRERLSPRREPYWHRIARGRHLGFRKMTSGKHGTWIARALEERSGKTVQQRLGELADLADHLRFDAAQKAAMEWFRHLDRGGASSSKTVSDACRRYVDHLRLTKSEKAADDAMARFHRHVFCHQRLSETDLAKLTPSQLQAWRQALHDTPLRSPRKKPSAKANALAKPEISSQAAVRGNAAASKAGPALTSAPKRRSDSSINRDMNSFRAALNLAYSDGLVTSDFAWRSKLKPIKNADGRRDLYLDRLQRQQLVDSAVPDLAMFLRGLSQIPLRPGALAAGIAQDYDSRFKVLKIGKDKNGKDRRIKLPVSTAKLFDATVEGKEPDAPLFSRADGVAWNKDFWKGPIKEAACAAGLPTMVTAYTLRHSVITDLVHDGLDLLTVAQISGTSVAMIERHYGHLRSEVASSALERLVF